MEFKSKSGGDGKRKGKGVKGEMVRGAGKGKEEVVCWKGSWNKGKGRWEKGLREMGKGEMGKGT
jgi:hypothetical protein